MVNNGCSPFQKGMDVKMASNSRFSYFEITFPLSSFAPSITNGGSSTETLNLGKTEINGRTSLSDTQIHNNF